MSHPGDFDSYSEKPIAVEAQEAGVDVHSADKMREGVEPGVVEGAAGY